MIQKPKKKKKNKNTIPFIIASKIIRYLGINLPKEVKDLYSENYRTHMKNIKGHKEMEKNSMLMDGKNKYC